MQKQFVWQFGISRVHIFFPCDKSYNIYYFSHIGKYTKVSKNNFDIPQKVFNKEDQVYIDGTESIWFGFFAAFLLV